MRHRGWKILGVVLLLAAAQVRAEGPRQAQAPPKKILVEFFRPEAGDATPPDREIPARVGSGAKPLVILNFRADTVSRGRQSYYARILGRDLARSPSIVIDDRATETDRTTAGVSVALEWKGTGLRRSLTARVASHEDNVVGRDLLVGLALTEDPVPTRPRSGERDGRVVVEHHVVRRFFEQATKLERSGSKSLTFPVEIGDDDYPGRFSVAVFVQDRLDGAVYQAESIPWVAPPKSHGANARARRKPALPLAGFGFVPSTTPAQVAEEESLVVCPTCGALTTLSNLLNQSALRNRLRSLDISSLSMPMC